LAPINAQIGKPYYSLLRFCSVVLNDGRKHATGPVASLYAVRLCPVGSFITSHADQFAGTVKIWPWTKGIVHLSHPACYRKSGFSGRTNPRRARRALR
jgi:hypothetical protein